MAQRVVYPFLPTSGDNIKPVHTGSRPRQAHMLLHSLTNLICSGVSSEQILHSISQSATALLSLFQWIELYPNSITELLDILTTDCLSSDVELSDQIYSSLRDSFFISSNGPLLDYTLQLIQENEQQLNASSSLILHLTKVESLFSTLLSLYDHMLASDSELYISIQLFCSEVKDSSNFYSLPKSTQDSVERLMGGCRESNHEKLTLDPQFSNNLYYGASHRYMSVLPGPGEIQFRPRRSLRGLVRRGAYPDVETFLDVHFKLLREDMIRPIRQGVNNFFNNDAEFKKDLYVYSDVCMLETRCDERQGILYQVSFRPDGIRDISRIRWDRSKRLVYGTLLLIFPMDSAPGEEVSLCDPLWAIVANKDDKRITQACARGSQKMPNITIQFETGFQPLFSYNKRYYMLESRKVYYEAYKHTLNILKSMQVRSLPFPRILLGHTSSASHPSYVTQDTAYPMYQIFPFLREDKLRITGDWPPVSPILDDSQYRAVKLALTNQIAVIQGPPGTGKTYVGTHVMKVLLQARKRIKRTHSSTHQTYRRFNNRHTQERECEEVDKNLIRTLCHKPIVVVTYTNHALDQFLSSLLEFETDIIRIGSRSEDEKIKALSLRNKRDFRNGTLRKHEREELNVELLRVSRRLQVISRKLASVGLYSDDIEYYATPSQLKSLAAHPTYSPRDWYNCVDCGFSAMPLVTAVNADLPQLDETDTSPEVFSDSENEDAVDFNEDMVGYVSGDEFLTQQAYLCEREIRSERDNANNIYESAAFRNLWNLDRTNRYKLIDYWISLKKADLSTELERVQDRYNKLSGELKQHFLAIDYSALAKSAVVGMTTTGAAKNSELIGKLRPHIIFIEESAEVLEAHVVACLSESIQHLILIGDHKQLRPSFAEFSLNRYNLDLSLFERLVNNKFEHVTLQCQHRMRPEISQLVKHIYPNLIDDSTVFQFPSIKGVKFNLYFLDHKISEDRVDQEGLSKLNSFEAKFLANFTLYLLKQGYQESDITILTFYEAQKFSIKDELFKLAKSVRIRVSTVDKYQGEENKIILFSAVRSNKENNIGHCRIDNRVCVALSRAKEGLFLIGNSRCLREGGKRTGLWDKILDTFSDQLGSALPLSCQNHQRVTNVSCAGDFAPVREGGCNLPCNQAKPCGHECTLKCHPCSHEEVKCTEFCDRIRECGHQCLRQDGKTRKKCFENCGECFARVDKTLAECGHKMSLRCSQEPLHVLCQEKCQSTLACGHECPEKCGADCTLVTCFQNCERVRSCAHPCVKEDGRTPKKCYKICGECNFRIPKTLEQCEHILLLPCFQQPLHFLCKQPCIQTLECGHKCEQFCGRDCTSYPCSQPCKKVLSCGHSCTNACNTVCTTKCIQPCVVVKACNHPCVVTDGITPKHCSDQCGDCNFLVEKEVPSCKHKMRVSCSLQLTPNMCTAQCERTLDCGHNCPGLCREDCSKLTCKEHVWKNLPCGHEEKLPCPLDIKNPVYMCTKSVQMPLICGHVLTVDCAAKSEEQLEDLECGQECKSHLPCGHYCRGSCRNCIYGSEHLECKHTCDRLLVCGHLCEKYCHGLMACPPCEKNCPNWCPHKKCSHPCGEPCPACEQSCTWQCIHIQCDLKCSQPCTRGVCAKRCALKLKCGHQCIGGCGEPCPKVCRRCNKRNQTFQNKYGAEGNPSSIFILLEDCGHIFESAGFESEWIVKPDSISFPLCPICTEPIRCSVRFGTQIKLLIENMNTVKSAIIEEFRTSCSQNCIALRNATRPYSEFHQKLDFCILQIESLVKLSQALKLSYLHKLILLISHLCPHPPSLVSNTSYPQIYHSFIGNEDIDRFITDPVFKRSDAISLSVLNTYVWKCRVLALFHSMINLEGFTPSDEDANSFHNLFQRFLSQLENPSDKRAPVSEHITNSKCFMYRMGLKYALGDIYEDNNNPTISYPINCHPNGWYVCRRGHPFATDYPGVSTSQCLKCNQIYFGNLN